MINAYTWEDLRPGLAAGFEVDVTERMMRDFLATSGDANPLHLHDEYATDFGFRARVVYGMLTASFYSRLAGVYLPGRHCLLHGINADFNAPVYVGDRLRVRGEVAYKNDAFKRIEVDCHIKNQADALVSKARLRLGWIGDRIRDLAS
jgi:3-hydroxybutyryl-CoA dehydratase